jgi:anti-sigma factor RsiW
MNDCKYIISHDLHRYYDGELSHRDAGELEAHLPGCPACQRALASYAGLGVALREVFDEAPAPDLNARLMRRARELGEQSPRRVALGLLAAASILFVSSLFLVVYTEAGRAQGGSVMAQWEENVVWTPTDDDEYADAEGATLYAIHLQENGVKEYGDD